jgi:hypothetical protein
MDDPPIGKAVLLAFLVLFFLVAYIVIEGSIASIDRVYP